MRALFACGLQEGVFPACRAPSRSSATPSARRSPARSGLRLRRRDDLGAERYLFYATVSRPEERLYLSWHEAGDDGDQAVRSFFVSDVCDLFGPRLASATACARSARSAGPGAAPTERERLRAAAAAARAIARRRSPRSATRRSSASCASARRGRRRAIELWASCPVKWFVERQLPPEGLTPDPELMLRGVLAHGVLEATLRGLRERTGSSRLDAGTLPPRASSRRRRSSGCSARPTGDVARPAPPARARAPPARRPAALPRARRRRRLRARAERSRSPSATATTAPPLELAGGVRIRGRIDRIDRGPGGEAIVYDYKGRNAPDSASGARAQVPDRAVHARRARRPRPRPDRRPLPAARRPRPAPARAVLDGADPGLDTVATDRHDREGFDAIVDGVLEDVLCAVGELRAGALEPRPQSCGWKGRLRVPDDLPLRRRVSVLRIGPGDRPFTDEQSAAIRAREGSLLLEANAGSGKTSVLVERFVRSVLDDGIRPARILAITFTERAAGELRARVRERFVELAAATRRARPRPRGSRRSTASARGCCARTRSPPGWIPAFDVLDEADRAHAARPRLGPRARRAARRRARRRRAGSRRRLRHRPPAADDRRRPRRAAQRRPDAAAPAARRRRSPTRARCARALAAAARARPPRSSRSRGRGHARRRGARRSVERCVELLRAPRARRAPARCAFGELRFGAAANALKSDACARYLAALDAYAGACRDRAAAAAVALLDELLGRYATPTPTSSAPARALDFDDLELFARDLLEREPALRRSYAERFDRVMVDEFQDSNPRQFALFEALDRDDLFVVGDEQQSIYGFRNADVELFRAHRARLCADPAASRRWRRTSAAAGRSSTRSTRPSRRAWAPASSRCARAASPRAAGAPLVELLLTDQDGWDGRRRRRPRRAAAGAVWRHAEARLLAQRLRDLVDAGDARPEDIVVLLRGLGDLPVYERALEDQGLLTLSVGGRGYWGRQVVRDLCAWLAALANPRDEAALYGVLASPLVGVSSDALAHVARAGRGNAWRAIERAFAATRAAPARARPRRACATTTASACAFRARFAAERALAPRLGARRAAAPRRRRDRLRPARAVAVGRRRGGWRTSTSCCASRPRSSATTGATCAAWPTSPTAELEAEARETDAPSSSATSRPSG